MSINNVNIIMMFPFLIISLFVGEMFAQKSRSRVVEVAHVKVSRLLHVISRAEHESKERKERVNFFSRDYY